MKNNWKTFLKSDPTDWLLEEENPAVRYRALRDVVDADEKEVFAARRTAHREGPIADILDAMNPEGWWVHPRNVYSPKCQGTSWSVLALAQMGASVEEDARIGTACNYLIDTALSEGGQFGSYKTITCFQGNMLSSLIDLGCRDDRLSSAFEWTARTVTGEGLMEKFTNDGLPDAGTGKRFPLAYVTGPMFACRANNGNSCAWAGEKVMLALSRCPEKDRTPRIDAAIRAGVDYFFTNDPASGRFPGQTEPEPDKRWWKFMFPVSGMDLLQVAEALVALGYGSDPRLTGLLDLIRSKQDEQGRWQREKNYGHWHKWWADFGPFNKPNKWVTLRAMRVLKQAHSA